MSQDKRRDSEGKGMSKEMMEYPSPQQQMLGPKRWLVEKTLPGGSVKWDTFEHEHHARTIAEKSGATVTPLYDHPSPERHVTDRNLIAAAVRMALESAAHTAYRVCAETRHVTLGEKARGAIRALADDLPPQSRAMGTDTTPQEER